MDPAEHPAVGVALHADEPRLLELPLDPLVLIRQGHVERGQLPVKPVRVVQHGIRVDDLEVAGRDDLHVRLEIAFDVVDVRGGREPLPRLSFRDVLEIHHRVLDRLVRSDQDQFHLAHAAAARLSILGGDDLPLVGRAPLEEHLALDGAPVAHGHDLVGLSRDRPPGRQGGDRERQRCHSSTRHDLPHLPLLLQRRQGHHR